MDKDLYVIEWNDIPVLIDKEELKDLKGNFGNIFSNRKATPEEVNDLVHIRVRDITSGKIDDNPSGYYPHSWNNKRNGGR